MKIEIKSLKVYEGLSEETTAYTAVVYVDGKKAFHARNDGHGGPDFFYRVGTDGPSLEAVDAWIAQNYPRDEQYKDLVPSLEIVVGDLINHERARKRLARLLKAKVLVFSGGKLYSYKVAPTRENIERLSAKGQVINGNAALEASALKMM